MKFIQNKTYVIKCKNFSSKEMKRLSELGFNYNTEIKLLAVSLLKGSIIFLVRGSAVCLTHKLVKQLDLMML